jgi:hypothetical protein
MTDLIVMDAEAIASGAEFAVMEMVNAGCVP